MLPCRSDIADLILISTASDYYAMPNSHAFWLTISSRRVSLGVTANHFQTANTVTRTRLLSRARLYI
jgi:hypothetical protein